MNAMLRWFSTNHVAANLLMVLILAAGFMSALSIKQEVFPEMDMEIVTVRVPFLGATPAEVEESVCIKIEEQVQAVDGVKKITSQANEGMGVVTIELNRSVDVQKVLDEIKSEVDRIVTFPAETEKPIVTQVNRKYQVIDVILYGDADERTLKTLADNVRDDLTALADITYAEVGGTRPYEISIEVSEASLRRYGLSFADVTRAVRLNSLDMPGGSVKTDGGEILVRTKGQRYTGDEFADIVVITHLDGTTVTLDRIAEVRDGFEDVDLATGFDGRRASMISVYRTGDEGVIEVTDAVKGYVQRQRELLPTGIEIDTWHDRSTIYKGRMNLLIKNGAIGLVLVFLCLAAFLQLRLAFWVALGIGISFLGAFWVIPQFNVSLNMISMFAFIVSLGIVVDDAIVIGENIYAHREMGKRAQRASTEGAIEVAGPVTFAVLTTVVAFLPLANVTGTMGKFMFVVPVVVIAILLFSLVESLLILPAHLATIRQVSTPAGAADGSGSRTGGDGTAAPGGPSPNRYRRIKNWFQHRSHRLVHVTYRHHLQWVLGHRAVVVALAFAGFLITMGLVAGGHIRFTFMPKVDADNITATVTMPQGTTVVSADDVVQQIEESLSRLQDEVAAERQDGQPAVFRHMRTTVGSHPSLNRTHMGSESGAGAHLIEVDVELAKAEVRGIGSTELARRWRELTGPISGATSVNFSADLFRGSKAIQIQLSSPDTEQLLAASQHLKQSLSGYPGVTDISDSFVEGKLEMKLSLKPEARTLGLTLSDLARQVRQGFYGDEAMRIQRGRDEVKVMVRYPERQRSSLGHIENMMVRTPSGGTVPFGRVAAVEIGRGYATIERADRQRIVNVFGDVDQTVTNAQEVLADLETSVMPVLVAQYPELRYTFEGQERDRAESVASLGRGFVLALLMIYVLLAVLFRSYLQPVVVMLAIPFGLMGAVWGHIVMGWNLTLLSMFGVVALTGVVVNDSLIMIDFINRKRAEGLALRDAVIESGIRRFRPILLTSITTFAGLTPLLLEKSLQARFLIPMGISLGFGVIFATGITLILIPTGYTLLADAKLRLGIEQAVADPGEVETDQPATAG